MDNNQPDGQHHSYDARTGHKAVIDDTLRRTRLVRIVGQLQRLCTWDVWFAQQRIVDSTRWPAFTSPLCFSVKCRDTTRALLGLFEAQFLRRRRQPTANIPMIPVNARVTLLGSGMTPPGGSPPGGGSGGPTIVMFLSKEASFGER